MRKTIKKLCVLTLVLTLCFSSLDVCAYAVDSDLLDELEEVVEMGSEQSLDSESEEIEENNHLGEDESILSNDEFNLDSIDDDSTTEETSDKESDFENEESFSLDVDVIENSDVTLVGANALEVSVSSIENYIRNNYDNSKNNTYTISNTDENGMVHTITLNYNTNRLVFNSQYKSSNILSLTISMEYSLSDYSASKVYFSYLGNTTPICSVSSNARINQSEYRIGDILRFEVSSSVGISQYPGNLQYDANAFTRSSMASWNEILYDRCNSSFSAIGFDSIHLPSEDNIDDLIENETTGHYSAVQDGEQKITDGGLSSTISAWKMTRVKLEKDGISCKIRLEDLYTGDSATEKVKSISLNNTIPGDGETWVVYRFYIENQGSEQLYVKNIFSSSRYCNEYMNDSSPVSYAFFPSDSVETGVITGTESGVLQPGESGYFWDGIKIKGSYIPYIKLKKGYDNRGKYEYNLLNTNPTYFRATYKVTFDPHGGDVDCGYFELGPGDLYGELPVPSYDDHDFEGWFDSLEYINRITESSTIIKNADHTLYAKWSGEDAPIAVSGITLSKNNMVLSPGESYQLSYVIEPSNATNKEVTWRSSNENVATVTNGTIYALTEGTSTITVITTDGGHYGQCDVIVNQNYSTGEYFSCVRPGVQKGLLDNQTNPQSAWMKTEIDFNYNNAANPTDCIIRIEEMYTGSQAYQLVKAENRYNETPASNQQWIVYRIYLENCGGPTMKASYVLDYDSLYTSTGARLSPEFATLKRKDEFDVSLEPGAADSFWMGILVDKSIGFPYFKLRNGRQRTWLDTNPSSGIVKVYFDAYSETDSYMYKSVSYGGVYGDLPTPDSVYGYDFAGWSTKPDGTTIINDKSVVSIKGDHTLYAVLRPHVTTIICNGNGGVSEADRLHIEFNQKYKDLPKAYRKGYTFDGWYDSPEGGRRIDEQCTVDSTEDVALYAHWIANEYVVEFDSCGGQKCESKQVVFDTCYGELPSNIEKCGYSFLGWYTKARGGELVTSESVLKSAEKHILYAHWKGNEYTISYDACGGTVNADNKLVVFGDCYGYLPDAQKEGAYFAGWYTESEGGINLDENSIVSIDQDHILYAHWTTQESKGIVMNYGTLTMSLNTSKQLIATISPSNSGHKAKWSSSAPEVVTVQGGLVNAVSMGRATITAKTIDGMHSATCDVVVTRSDAIYDAEIKDDTEVPDRLWCAGLENTYNYTGSKITPAIKVYYGHVLLREKAEYTVSYSNNINAGIATITITGKGNYTGKCKATFEILSEPLGEEDVDIAVGVANGNSVVKPIVTVTHEGKTLKADKDYRLKYQQVVGEGTTEVIVSGINNYKGQVRGSFIVKAKNSPSLKKAVLTGLSRNYTIKQIELLKKNTDSLDVKIGKNIIPKNEYNLKFENCDRVGKGIIVIQPTPEGSLAGEKRVPISIIGTKLGSILVDSNSIFNGETQVPTVRVYSGSKGSGSLISPDCYDIAYNTSLVNAGTITVTATAKATAGYSGKVSCKYKISQRAITDSGVTVSMPATIYYKQGGTTPSPLVNYSNGEKTWTLREGIDYTINYANNKVVGGAKTPTYTITGKGNFTGKTVAKSFTINKSNINTLAMSCSNIVANSKKKGSYYYSKPVIYDINGKALKENTDYTVTYTNLTTGSPIGKLEIVPAGTKIKADIITKENNYTGKAEIVYEVVNATVKDLKSVKVGKIANLAYTGSPVELESLDIKYVTGSVKNKVETSLVGGQDYVITAYYNNVKKGTASLRIEGRGDYCGSKIISFKIVAANNANIWDGVYRK